MSLGIKRFACILVVLSAVLAGPGIGPAARAETVTLVEDFTTSTQADLLLTTAWWDTGAGQLRLHPQGLAEIGALNLTGTSYASAWSADHLLVATGEADALAVVDVSDPGAPVLVRSHPVSGLARHVLVAGDWAYVALGSGLGLQTVDISNVALPSNVGQVSLGSFTGETVLAGDYAYTASYNGGVGVVNIVDPANPVALPMVDLTGWVRGLDRQGAYLYLATNAELTVMSLAAPDAPDSLAAVAVSGSTNCVTAAGNWAYVGGSAGLDVIDISQPSTPLHLAALDLGGGAVYDIAVQGDSLFVANGNNGLKIVDITNPALPEVVATRTSPQYFYHILPQAGLLWASNGGGGVLGLQADGQGLDPVRNLAVSNNLNPAGEPVQRVRLAADYSDSIRFEVTPDGGGTWLELAPDDSWLDFSPQGTDLRWRASLVQNGPWPGPVCNSLILVWERVHSYAEISGVTDVPGDTGGLVRVGWLASRYDAPDLEHLVTEYSVYRRYDSTAGAEGNRKSRSIDPALAYPPGDWEFLTTVPADQEAVYATTVPTVADSSDLGPNWSVFFVRARTSVPGVFFDSPPDSGYSLNNLAPPPPTGFVVDRGTGPGVQLSWDPSPLPDFAHFRIYRQTSPLAPPTPAALYLVTTGTSHFDDSPGTWFYHLTVVNLAGQESPPSPHASAVPFALAGGGFLGPNVPNPFNPATRIAYAVPPGGARVKVEIFDLRGLRVRLLVDEVQAAGEQAIVWRGADDRGRAVASGLYSCRLHLAGQQHVQTLTLVR